MRQPIFNVFFNSVMLNILISPFRIYNAGFYEGMRGEGLFWV